jgi:hypothetical protein
MDNSRSKTDWVKTISSIGVIVGLIFGGINFAYNEWYKVPQLTYETLDSYPLSGDESIVPIIIRNEGHEKATNVRITIYTGGNIQIVQQKTPEELRLSNENNTLIATLSRLVDNTQITLYLKVKTLSSKPINEILISSDQGSGGIHETKSQLADSLILIGTILTSVGLFMIIRKLPSSSL